MPKFVDATLDIITAIFTRLERFIGFAVGAFIGMFLTVLMVTWIAGDFHFTPWVHLIWKLGPGALLFGYIGYRLSGFIMDLLSAGS